jgi:TRAP-type C4-dicarboxylate transport system permease small subunit
MTNELQEDSFEQSIGEIEEVTDDISDVTVFDIPVLIIFAILFVIVALQFFTRYVLNDSLGWTEEIARYFLILVGFVGSITCVRKSKHISLEFIYHYLPVKTVKPIVLFVDVIVTAFWGFAGWLAIELAQKTNSNMVSVALPKSYLYFVVSAACFVMAIFAFLILVRHIGMPAQEMADEKLQQEIEAI